MSDFSVIIPTLQRAKELHELVEMCATHPRVLEVLVINNAADPLAWESPKVRVLQQDENIFVNPAWNLGAREARGKYLAILNDDIEMQADVFDYAAKLLATGRWGVVGPDPSCFTYVGPGPVSHRIGTHVSTLVGTCMLLRREDYVPIPEQMRIWGGDDWLILSQRRPPAVLIRTPFRTDMSTTSGSPEFQRRRQAEWDVARPLLDALEGARWWHPVVRAVHAARKVRHRVRAAARQ